MLEIELCLFNVSVFRRNEKWNFKGWRKNMEGFLV